MQQSTLFLPFMLHVFAPIVALLLLIRLLSLYIQRDDQGHEQFTQRMKDLRLILRVMTIPLLLLLFFNFQNTIYKEHVFGQGITTSQPNDPWSQSLNHQEVRKGSKAHLQDVLTGETSRYFGWVVLAMFGITLLILLQIRFSPKTTLPISYHPSALWQAISMEPEARPVLHFLRWWWLLHIPLMMLMAMYFLPSLWLFYMTKTSFYLALACFLYALWQTRNIVHTRHAYLEELFVLREELWLMQLRHSLSRIAHDQASQHPRFMLLAYQEHQERLRFLQLLLIAMTFFGYAVL